MNNYVNIQSKSSNRLLSERLLKTYKKLCEDRIKTSFTGNLLDIGCGNGDFIYSCNLRNDLRAYGIDYPEIDIETEPIFKYKTNFFDIITINAVIEHLVRPDNLMKEIYRHLKPNGIVCLTTPNWHYSKDTFFNDPTHIHPYTQESLQFLFEMYDFELLHISPNLINKPNFFYDLPYIWYLSSKLFSKSIMAIFRKKPSTQKQELNILTKDEQEQAEFSDLIIKTDEDLEKLLK